MGLGRAGRLVPPLLCLLSAARLGADESFQEENRNLEHVQVTATRREASAFDVAAAVTQVTREQVAAGIPDVLAEMLRGLPGTYFQQTTPGQGIPIIRGLKGSQVLHLVDGMRLNNAFFRSAPNQYLGLVDAFAAERIEVVRGAAGALYGADAMGGVVNILMPEPSFSGGEWRSSGSFYGAFNSADEGWTFRAEARGGREGLGLSGGVTWQDHSHRKSGHGRTFRPSAYRSEAADFKLVTRADEDADLMLSAQVLEQPSTPRVDELVPGYGQDSPASAQFEFMPNRRSFLHARYRRQGAATWYDGFEVHLARQVIRDDRLTRDDGESLVTTEFNESVLDGLTLQFTATLNHDTDLSWGLEYYADAVESRRHTLDTVSGRSTRVRSRFPDDSTMDSSAAYLAGEWHGGGRLMLGGGLRFSTFDIRLPATPDAPLVTLQPNDFTGDLHLLYGLTPSTRLVANLGRGFRPPNIFDLGTLGARPGNRFNIANPDLRSESVWSYDIGFKSSGATWQSEVFAFHMDYQDKITSVTTGETTPEGRAVVRSENRNRVTLFGLEAGLRWQATDRVEIYGMLNYTRGEEEDATGAVFPADRIPPLNGKLGIILRPRERLSLEAHFLFADDQGRLSLRDADDPRINPLGTPAWGTFNVLFDWRAGEALHLGLKLENLADKSYREHGSGIDAPGFNVGLWLHAVWP